MKFSTGEKQSCPLRNLFFERGRGTLATISPPLGTNPNRWPGGSTRYLARLPPIHPSPHLSPVLPSCHHRPIPPMPSIRDLLLATCLAYLPTRSDADVRTTYAPAADETITCSPDRPDSPRKGLGEAIQVWWGRRGIWNILLVRCKFNSQCTHPSSHPTPHRQPVQPNTNPVPSTNLTYVSSSPRPGHVPRCTAWSASPGTMQPCTVTVRVILDPLMRTREEVPVPGFLAPVMYLSSGRRAYACARQQVVAGRADPAPRCCVIMCACV